MNFYSVKVSEYPFNQNKDKWLQLDSNPEPISS